MSSEAGDTLTGDQGGHQEGGGKYLAVWRRNGGGQWRIVAISANEYEEPKK
jgi:ketosteroid isomerase-like protein